VDINVGFRKIEKHGGSDGADSVTRGAILRSSLSHAHCNAVVVDAVVHLGAAPHDALGDDDQALILDDAPALDEGGRNLAVVYVVDALRKTGGSCQGGARNRLAASELERRWNVKLEEIEAVRPRRSICRSNSPRVVSRTRDRPLLRPLGRGRLARVRPMSAYRMRRLRSAAIVSVASDDALNNRS
jgi:hypothetical protein